MLQRAIELHRAGQLGAAEAAYRQLLAVNPSDAQVLHLLGLLMSQSGRQADAVALLRAALRHAPNQIEARHHLGLALAELGELEGAITALRHTLRLHAQFLPARLDLAETLLRAGRRKDAETTIRAALRQAPENARAHNILGLTLAGTDEEAALACFEAACALADSFYLEAHSNRALTLVRLGRRDEAESRWRDILVHAPHDLTALTALHGLLSGDGRLAEDEPVLRRMLHVMPQDAALHFALGDILARTHRPDAALAAFSTALALAPDDPGCLHAKAVVLYDVGRFAESLELVERAAALAPDDPDIQTSLAFAYLLRRDYARGWRLFEWRNEKPGNVRLAAPRWDGTATQQTVLIHSEQGIGDTLQFCRFLALAATRAPIVFAGPAACRGLFEQFSFLNALCTEPPLPSYDVQLPLMSLPFVLGVDEADFAACVPYIKPCPSDIAAWDARLPARPARRIGLVWAGNPQFPADQLRSIPFGIFHAILDVPDCNFISLQKNAGADAAHPALIDVAADLTDFAATAACLCALDLVISVDTAAAHLAGSLGRPAWLLNRAGTDWRWGLHAATTPWYPTMRIFRQTTPGDWDGVIEAVCAALRVQAASGENSLSKEATDVRT